MNSDDRLFSPMRRKLLKAAPLALLAGCDISPSGKTETLLKGFQSLNDWVQAKVFDPTKLAPEYEDYELTPESGFRVNGYDTDEPDIDIPGWKLSVEGAGVNSGGYTLQQI